MHDKKQSAEWKIALVYFLSTFFIYLFFALLIIFIPGFVLLEALIYLIFAVPYAIPFLIVCAGGGSLLIMWFGTRFSANYVCKKYVVKNANKIIKLATLYYVIINVGSALFNSKGMLESQDHSLTIAKWIIQIVGLVVFYVASKKYIRNNDEITESEFKSSIYVWGILISLFVIIAGIILLKITFVKPVPTPPLEVGIQLGENTFSKNILASQPGIGDVTSIKVLPSSSNSEAILLVVGDMGAMTLNSKGKLLSLVEFDERAGKVEPVSERGSGEFEYANKGGGWQPVSLFSSTGKTIWKYQSPETPDEMTAVDINDDGILEFIVGMNAGGGIRAFDRNGNELWKQNASNVFSVATVVVDGSTEIVHTDGSNIVIRSLKGDKLQTIKLPFVSFFIGKWPDNEHPVIIGMDKLSIKAFNLNGSPVGSLPIARDGTDVATVPIAFNGQKTNAAVVSLRASSNLSEFYIFDKQNAPIYHEIFNNMNPVVAEIPSQNGETEAILVGGSDGKVTKYQLKK